MISAKVIEDSISEAGVRLCTLQLTYPRMMHADFMTHRVFSRNASSSRAIPVKKLIAATVADMVEPVRWGLNQPGMQASEQNLEGAALVEAQQLWRYAAYICAETAGKLADLGLHKQWANRMIEWFGHIHVIVTATGWSNYFELRDHPDAMPEIQMLAQAMKEAMASSTPVLRPSGFSEIADGWHLPYVIEAERISMAFNPRYLAKLSAARCARVSYLNHDGTVPDPAKDVDLYDKLVGSRPLHASPVEHQGYPGIGAAVRSGNFKGWVQHRKLVEAEIWGDSSEPALNTEDAPA